MVSSLVKSHASELKRMVNAKGKARTKKLLCCSDRCIKAIVNALQLVLNKAVPLTSRQLNSARKKKRSLLNVTSPHSSVTNKRKLLIQDGSLLGFIAPLLAKVAGPLLGSIFGGMQQ